MAFSGVSGAFLTMFLLPALQSRFSTIGLYRFLLKTYPLQFLLFPLVNLLARYTIVFQETGDPGAENWPTPPAGIAVWLSVAVILFINRAACMCFS